MKLNLTNNHRFKNQKQLNHKKPQEKIEPPNKTLNQTKTRQQNIEQKPKTEQVSNTISNNFNNSNRSSSITFTGN